eukprot:TRINITY_DN16152_c0_g4_i1.p1 TRINITY_DN16152_c0_g4~~TRINITY_DN16152_c0_g4_i1.p1  ORF type:complete len:826 (+),score=335.60 TRINITY_DN16152_c0_g4_i1:629-3106(+)
MSKPPPKMKTQTGNVKVMVRVRPFSKREKAWCESHDKELRPIIKADGPRIAVLDPENEYCEKDAFSYDEVFWSTVGYDSVNGIAGQHDVYEKTGAHMLRAALEGYNCCIFAYGQTGAGKTHTMLGSPDSRGISYILIDELFKHIDKEQQDDPGTKYTVEVSFMEIYNEQVRDLFNKKAKPGEYSDIKIRQDPVKGIIVQGLISRPVSSAAECAKEMERGVNERALAETKMNATSSRSHAICQISILQLNPQKGLRKSALINLVDLAGSERLKMSCVEGLAAKEAKNINLSLSTLRKVFDTLIANSKKKNPKTHEVPPYRESMLTWVLKESLGGNSMTLMIAAISPHEENLEDTYSTLRYALKAKSIVNKVICNEVPSAKMVENLREELEALKEQLRTGGGGTISEEREKEFQEELLAKEEALQEALQEAVEVEHRMQEAQKELQLEVDTSRKQKFAAAFRSAFVINKDTQVRKGMELDLADLRNKTNHLQAAHDVIQEQNQEYKVTIASLQKECAKFKNEGVVYKQESEQNYANFQKHKKLEEEYRAASEQLQLDVDSLKSAKAALESKLRRATTSLTSTTRERDEFKERAEIGERDSARLNEKVQEMQRQLDEVKKENHMMKTERNRLARQLEYDLPAAERKAEEMTEMYEAMTRKKDGYKKQCIALQLIHEADTKIINALKEERSMQRAAMDGHIAEKEALLSSRSDLDRAVEKSRRLQDDLANRDMQVKGMEEEMKAYKQATSEWSMSSAYIRSELERVTKEHQELKNFVTSYALNSPSDFQGSPYRSSHSPPSPKSSHARTRASLSPRYSSTSPNTLSHTR